MIVEIVGKFYDNHSLTIINRNIAIGLAKKFDVYLTSLDQFDPEFKLNSDIVGELKKLEAKDCWRLKPACLNKAPSAMKLQAKANAGLRMLIKDLNPCK